MARSGAGTLLYLAAALYGSLWLFLSQTAPVWSEDILVYPAQAARVLAHPSAEDPGPTFEASCADRGPIRLVATTDLRPRVAVCVRGRQYPLQITSYASGLPYWISDLFWPLHRGQVFRLRVAGLFLGLLSIALTRRLLLRFADTVTANVAALCMAVSPAFLLLHSTLLHHEVLPWIACAAAIEQLSQCRALSPTAAVGAEPPPTGRLLAAAALLGLALIANLKTVFLIAPLCVMALRAGVRITAIRPRQWLLAAAVLAVVVSPSIVGNVANVADLSQELLARQRTLTAQMHPMRILAEIPNLALFWGDTLLVGALASGNLQPPSAPGLLVTIPALFYCLFSGIAYLWRGRGRIASAACGLMILSFIFVSALLYSYDASGNYMPLTAVLGVGTAATAVDASGWLASRLSWSVTRTRTVVVGLTLAALIWSVVGRGSPTHFITMPINAAAERELGAYLTANPDPDAPVVVTTYILAGVPEAVTGGSVDTIKASNYFDCPPGRNTFPPLESEALEEGRRCVRGRFERLLDAFPGPVRFLFPVKTTLVDDALAGEFGPSLEAVALATGRTLGEDVTFAGWDTGPLLRLVRVEAAPMQHENHQP